MTDAQTTIKIDGLTWAPWDDLRTAKARIAELEAEVARLREAFDLAISECERSAAMHAASRARCSDAKAYQSMRISETLRAIKARAALAQDRGK